MLCNHKLYFAKFQEEHCRGFFLVNKGNNNNICWQKLLFFRSSNVVMEYHPYYLIIFNLKLLFVRSLQFPRTPVFIGIPAE